jgi:DNA-binding MurR/RpiR family transcriptional regulator
MQHRDVLVIFDFRRYQVALETLARMVAGTSKPRTVLYTDKWLSPIAKFGAHVVPLPMDIGTAWDTLTPGLALVEAMVVKVSEKV